MRAFDGSRPLPPWLVYLKPYYQDRTRAGSGKAPDEDDVRPNVVRADYHSLRSASCGIDAKTCVPLAYSYANRHERAATWSEATPGGRFRAYAYDELVARDKCSLDLFWLEDESLRGADNLPDPDEIAAEIADDLRAALAQIEEILSDLPRGVRSRRRSNVSLHGSASVVVQGLGREGPTRWPTATRTTRAGAAAAILVRRRGHANARHSRPHSKGARQPRSGSRRTRWIAAATPAACSRRLLDIRHSLDYLTSLP